MAIVEDADQQPGAGHGVEGLPESGQAPDVQVDKPCGKSSLTCFVVRIVERHAGQAGAGGVEAAAGAYERVLAGPAAGVQHPALDGTRLGEGQECRLGPDVPARLAVVHGVPLRAGVRAPGSGWGRGAVVRAGGNTVRGR